MTPDGSLSLKRFTGPIEEVIEQIFGAHPLAAGMMFDFPTEVITAALKTGISPQTFTRFSIEEFLEPKNGGGFIHRRVGIVPKVVTLDELGHNKTATAISQLMQLHKLFYEKTAEYHRLRAKIRTLQDEIEHEPELIKNAIWDQFPDFMGQPVGIQDSAALAMAAAQTTCPAVKVEVASVEGGQNYVLVVDGEPQENVTVDQRFGAEIAAREAALEEKVQQIATDSAEVSKIDIWLDAKREMLPKMLGRVRQMLAMNCPDVDGGFVDIITDPGTGAPAALIHENIDETSEEIPPYFVRMLVGAHLSGENVLPPKLQGELGVIEAIAAADKAIADAISLGD